MLTFNLEGRSNVLFTVAYSIRSLPLAVLQWLQFKIEFAKSF
jgi:hypothetical protein